MTEILHYTKGIYELLAAKTDEENLLQPLKRESVGKRKTNEPLTASKIKKSLLDLEESYQTVNFESLEDDEDMPHFEYTVADNLMLDEEETKPLVRSMHLFEFPLTEQDQVTALEAEIGRPNSRVRKQLIETIHTIQGSIKDHKVTIRTFLRVVFTDELLITYTWKGHESKKALCELKNLMTFLKKILVRWFPDSDLSDFVKTIQNYVKNCPSRVNTIRKKVTDDDNM